MLSEDHAWLAAGYAARQPRGNALWESIVDKLNQEVDDYLAFWYEVRYA